MKKVFKPLWSLDVTKTEHWLSTMASQGFQFITFNRWTRCFYFQQGVPKIKTYRITFDHTHSQQLASTLLHDGWQMDSQQSQWSIISNEKAYDQINTFPTSNGIIKRKQFIKYLFTLVVSFLPLIFLLYSCIPWESNEQPSGNGVESPSTPYLAFPFVLALILLGLYVIRNVKKTNERLLLTQAKKFHKQFSLNALRDKEKERLLRRSGKLIRKYKSGWIYAPDKLEKWLESMEEQGFNLYRISKRGVFFYFEKGSPRKVSYCVDYQNTSNRDYFELHRDAGWQDVFSSHHQLETWAIWSQNYSINENRPEIYSDKTHHLSYAKRIALTYTAFFFPLIAVNIYNVRFIYEEAWNNGFLSFDFIFMVSFILPNILLGSFMINTWLYMYRVKRQYIN
jgi:hypothetical protein